MRRFYLATRKDRAAEAAAVTQALEARGWQRTLDWSARDDNVEGYAEIAVAELAAVSVADVLLVLLPGGYGTHAEIGAALALGKPVVIHAPNRNVLEKPYPCVFHYHPRVTLIVSETVDSDALVGLVSSAAQ